MTWLERIGLAIFRWLRRRGPHTRQAMAQIIAYEENEQKRTENSIK